MKFFLSLFILINFSNCLLAQPEALNLNFVGDTFHQRVKSKLEIEIEDLMESNNDNFQFRLAENHLSTSQDNIFILTRTENRWKAQYFTFNTAEQSKISKRRLTEIQISQEKINELWEKLAMCNALTLPSENQIKAKMTHYLVDSTKVGHYGNQKRIMLTDGISYSFTVQLGDKQRRYTFGCPYTMLQHYPNVKELYDAYMMISLIKQHLGRKYDGC